MELLNVTKIIYEFLNWIYKLVNALGITVFNEQLTNMMAELA